MVYFFIAPAFVFMEALIVGLYIASNFNKRLNKFRLVFKNVAIFSTLGFFVSNLLALLLSGLIVLVFYLLSFCLPSLKFIQITEAIILMVSLTIFPCIFSIIGFSGGAVFGILKVNNKIT